MSNNSNPLSADRSLTVAMIAFVAAFGLHGVDHFRRGMTASPPAIMAGGMIQGLLVVVALVLVLRRHRSAPRFASFVGWGSAALFTYAHVLPTFLPDYQDSFSYGPRVNVTWFSWLTAAGEIGAGLALGYIGLRVRKAANQLAPQGNRACCTSKSTSA
ncbi:hypothetical protein [Mycobacterium sp. pR1184]|uniref:hypothetical protein n=1 Tax=Mycobacterium sp. pR1184 TaxID=3238981 RepID=UPI00351B760A